MDAEPIKKKLHRYYDMIAGGVCLVRQSAEEQILFVNKEMLKLYQCKTEQEFYQLTKGRFAGLMEADDYMPLEARMNSRHGEAEEGYAFLAFCCYTKEGVYLHVEGTFQNGTVPGFGKVWMLNLVNKERSMAVSDLDPVTGLLNMHAFYQRVEKKIDAQRAKRQPDDTGMLYCPVYLNLTNFKVYNETHGLYEGDRMLRKIGQLLKSKFPSSYVTRLSGDNFALFVPRAGLEIKIRDICQAVNNEIHIPNITMKAGIGSFDEEDGARRRAITAYFDQAKLACDSIKKDATRFAAFYHASMRRSMADRIFILDNLDRAIEQGHIQVYYQPVIRTMTGKLCGCEALARWIDPVKGTLSPGSFIPVLEESRLISRLDRHIIEEVAKLLRYQLENKIQMVPISVNLSRYDFMLMDPLAFVERIVEQYHIPRYYLRIEVTASVLVKNRHLLIDKLRQFHQSGYQVWLDDFGSAYSSLNVLQNYEFDELKIDQGLLRYFNEDSRKIIRSIVLMAKEMGIHVLAEGAETKEHVDFLRSLGCEKIQGYYYGRPLPYGLLCEHCRKSGWQIETLSEEQACDAAGLVNIITDAPVAIFQYHDDVAQIISENEAYQKVLATSGTSSQQEFNANMKTVSYPMREKFLTLLANAAKSDREEHMTFVENGQYLRLVAKRLANTADFTLILARLANITYGQDLTSFHQYENVFRNLMLIYDGIYFIDRAKEELHVIESMTAHWQAGDVVTDFKAMADTYAQHYIYAEDRTRFRHFLRPDVIYCQAERSGRSKAIEMFRVKKPDGRFVWMIFDAIVIYKSAAKDILICVRENIWERQENLHTLLPQFLPYLQPPEVEPLQDAASLWHSACNFSPLPFYWKDTERRYRGFNPAFLDYLGIKDETSILGKTDEELGWCLQDEEEEQAEREVLRRGKVRKGYRTTVLVHGVPQRVALTSFPIYQGRKITGLLGYLCVQDAEIERREQEVLGILDRDTGFLGFRGMVMAGMRLEEVINDIITIGIQEPDPKEGIRKMMAKIGETLKAERFLIFEESGHGTVSSTYEWRRDTAESVMKDMQDIPIARIKPLYDHFAHNHMLILHEVEPFLQIHPGFQPVIQGLTSLVSGHLIQSGRSLGFTEVVNPASESFSSATFLLSSLTSVLAIMLRNRDMIHRLETYSYRDQLTGVGNRRALLSFIRTIPDGTSLAFFFGDINGLKVENDTKGHEAGDLLIKKAAAVLVAAAGPERVFRMGGDEFLLVVENITKQEADAMLKELRATYARQHVSVAIGCTIQVSPLRSIDTILSEADALMYENKRQMHAHHKES